MMINIDYAQAIAQAKSKGEPVVHFENNVHKVQPISPQKDTFTLSDKAIAMMEGKNYENIAHSYIKPETARTLLAQNELSTNDKETKNNVKFDEIFQNILDKRLGVDRKKLDEIDAMMKEISENEEMSPEEKAKALEELSEMREKIIEESMKIQEVAKQTI